MGRCQGFFCGAEVAALLRGRRAASARCELTVRRCVVVGGGPAGLAAAIELRRLGVAPVTVIEREREAGRHPAPLPTTRASGCATCAGRSCGPALRGALSRARSRGGRRAASPRRGHGLGRRTRALELTGPGGPPRLSSRARWSWRPAAASGRARRGSCPGSRPAGRDDHRDAPAAGLPARASRSGGAR